MSSVKFRIQSRKWHPLYVFYIRMTEYENWGFTQPLRAKGTKVKESPQKNFLLKYRSGGSQIFSRTLLQFARISGKLLPCVSVCSSESTWFLRAFGQTTVNLMTSPRTWLQLSQIISSFSILLSKFSVSHRQTLTENHTVRGGPRKCSLAFPPQCKGDWEGW